MVLTQTDKNLASIVVVQQVEHLLDTWQKMDSLRVADDTHGMSLASYNLLMKIVQMDKLIPLEVQEELKKSFRRIYSKQGRYYKYYNPGEPTC